MMNCGNESHSLARPSFLCAVLMFVITATVCATQSFTDGFEGTTINSFWTVEEYAPGAASLTSSVAHTGSQSLMLSAWGHAYHDFGSPQTGSISVWMRGSDVCCGEGAGLQVYDPGYSTWTLLSVGSGGATAGYGVGPDQSYYPIASVPSDWHHLEVHIDSAGARTVFDGAVIANNPDITAFQAVELVIWGGGSGGVVYFDDFLADSAPVVNYDVCLLYDKTRAVRSGSTIPIKLQLCTESGDNVSSPTLVLHAVSITQDSTEVSGPVDDSGNANPDDDFRFDQGLGSTGGYIFNLNTQGLTTGTYRLDFKVTGDSSTYSAPFQVK